jgi:hypothetical protein
VVLAVTTQTRSHVVLYERLCGSGLCHVTMTPGALHASANMRGMLKLHQSGGFKTIHALPGNFAPRGGKLGDLLDLRIAGSDFSVTQHTLGYRRDCRARTGVGATVTIQALQSMLDVYFVRVGDGLFGTQHGRGHCNHD